MAGEVLDAYCARRAERSDGATVSFGNHAVTGPVLVKQAKPPRRVSVSQNV